MKLLNINVNASTLVQGTYNPGSKVAKVFQVEEGYWNSLSAEEKIETIRSFARRLICIEFAVIPD